MSAELPGGVGGRARRWSVGVFASVSLLAAACGSTVATRGQSVQDQGQDGGLSGLPAAPGVVASGDPGYTSNVPSTLGPSHAPGGAHSAPTTGSAGRPGSVPGQSRGTMSGTIKIGFSVTAPQSLATGAAGTDYVDERAQAESVVRWLNAHGGLAGRRVVPVFREHDSSEPSTTTAFQGDCAAFTEDNKVFAAYSTAASANKIVLLAECMAAHKQVFLMATNSAIDTQQFARWAPYVYAPSMLASDRWKAYVDGLADLGYFTAGAKVGIVSFDEPAARRAVARIQGWLQARRVTVADTQYMASFDDYAGFGRAGAQVSNMVLKFKTEGVTHVLFVATYGAGGYLFPTAAQAQDYHPRYALSTAEFPQVIALNAPEGQLHNAAAVGWDPGWDVDYAQDKGNSPNQRLCYTIMKDQNLKALDRAATRRALGICDAMLFLKAVLDRAPVVSPQAFRTVVDRFGASHLSAVTHSTFFTAGRYHGVSSVRGMRYVDSCRCFTYVGQWRTAS